jgi:hypothetical protein
LSGVERTRPSGVSVKYFGGPVMVARLQDGKIRAASLMPGQCPSALPFEIETPTSNRMQYAQRTLAL